MPAALMLADVVAMPSTIPEPFGRVALEPRQWDALSWPLNTGGNGSMEGETGWLPSQIMWLARCLQLALKLGPRQRTIWEAGARLCRICLFHTENVKNTEVMPISCRNEAKTAI